MKSRTVIEYVRGKKVFCTPRSKEEVKRFSFAPVTSKLTTFATLKDLEAYIRCLLAGGSANGCYAKGDNGRGSWGDLTAQIRTPMAAIPPQAMIDKWGSSRLARGKMIKVIQLSTGKEVICEVRDKGPNGVVDINPAALVILGLPIDSELDERATWSWA